MNAAILLSRQMLFPSKNTPWIKKVCEAMRLIKKENLTLITSVGTQTWEMLIVIAKIQLVKQIIFVTADSIADFESRSKYYESQFKLDLDYSIKPIIVENEKKSEILKKRDSVILDKADILIPISIREKGNMSELLLKADQRKIWSNFEINYKEKKKTEVTTELSNSTLSLYSGHFFLTRSINDAEVNGMYAITSPNRFLNKKICLDDYYIHWTRTSKQKWWDENLYDHYFNILQSDTYPKSAFNTLMHIFENLKINGSSRHLSKNNKCVSFTGAKFESFEKLMRWRKRYNEMSFEPYGVGIEKKIAIIKGIEKVKYLTVNEMQKIKISDKWKYQSIGKNGNWSLEDEYRFNGNVDLISIPSDKIIGICTNKKEALLIKNKFNIFAYSIYEE